MTRVEILYNFYTSASRISINGQPISAVSALSRFQTLPFRQWYDQLLDVVEREVNDDFSLRLLARPVEGQLLQPLAAACPACRSYQRSGTPLDDPALRRLKHLSQRISTGAVPACPRQKFTVRLYCADPAALLRDAGLAKLLPRLAFCRPELQVLDIKALAPSDADATIVVTDTEPDSLTRVQLARCAPGTACAVHLGGRGTPAAGDIYFCSAPTMADLPGAVGDFLEFGPYVALLHRALDSYDPEQLGIHRAEVAAPGGGGAADGGGAGHPFGSGADGAPSGTGVPCRKPCAGAEHPLQRRRGGGRKRRRADRRGCGQVYGHGASARRAAAPGRVPGHGHPAQPHHCAAAAAGLSGAGRWAAAPRCS